MNRGQVKLLGFDVDTFDFDAALEYAYTRRGQIVTINPEMISCASSFPDFAKVISDAELVIPDGIGVELGLKILGSKVHRIAGIDFGKALIIKFSKENKSIAMVGAKQEILEKAVENLKSEIPNLNIVYTHNGYFTDDLEILDAVVNSNPDLLLAALGSPKQEFFINALKSRLPNTAMIGLGGSFDVWSGEVKRAPVIYQKLGLEWLYRSVCNPERFKRIFPALPLFLLSVLRERFSNK